MDNKDNSLFAFLLGATIGAAVALLCAPKTGKETRAQLKQVTREFLEDAEEVGTDIKEKSKNIVNESKVKVSEFVEKGIEKGKATYSKFRKKSVPTEEIVEPVVDEVKQEELIEK